MNTFVLSNSRDCYIELSDPVKKNGKWVVRRYRKRPKELICLSTDSFATRQDAVEFATAVKHAHDGFMVSGG